MHFLLFVLLLLPLPIAALAPSVTRVDNPPSISISTTQAEAQEPSFEEILEQKVSFYSEKYKISTTTLSNLIKNESMASTTVIGDKGCSIGIVQINICKHTEITREQALDLDFSLRYAASEIAEGRDYQWTVCSCTRYVNTLQPKFPVQDAKTVTANSPPQVGGVVILRYLNDGKWVYHVAYIKAVYATFFTIKEANFTPCSLGTRDIDWTDSHIVGYWAPK